MYEDELMYAYVLENQVTKEVRHATEQFLNPDDVCVRNWDLKKQGSPWRWVAP